MHVFLIILTTILLSWTDDPDDLPIDIQWRPFAEAVTEAQMENQKVFVYVHAPWCGPCHKLDKEVFARQEIRDYLNKHFQSTRLNFDKTDDRQQVGGYTLASMELARHLGVNTVPGLVFLDHDGNTITRITTYIGPEDFLQVLKFVATEAYRDMSFVAFRSLEMGE